VLDPISSPKYLGLFCFQSFSGAAHNYLVRGVQMEVQLACKPSDKKEVAFCIHGTFQMLVMIELDILDGIQQAVTLATGAC